MTGNNREGGMDLDIDYYASDPRNFKIDNGELEKYCGPASSGTVVIPDGVRIIGRYYELDVCSEYVYYGAFYKCDIKKVSIPGSVRKIRYDAFSDSSLTSVTIQNGLEKIDQSAFSDCKELTSVTIPDSVIKIEPYAFYGCDKLTEIIISPEAWERLKESLTYTPYYKNYVRENGIEFNIKEGVLTRCNYTKTETAYIPENNKKIGSGAFEFFRDCISVVIPDSVTEIEDYAFYHCWMSNVTISDSVTEIKRGVFYECKNLISVTIPNGVTKIGNYAFEDCESLTSVTIPDSVTEICSKAFAGCKGLTSVTIPGSVKKIGLLSFWGCINLTSVNVLNGVTATLFYDRSDRSIDCERLVIGCGGLADITISGGVKKIEEAFWNCYTLSSVTIPDGVKKIEINAFRDCAQLKRINIPDSVIRIGKHAFDNCKNLTDIQISRITWWRLKFSFTQTPFYQEHKLFKK
jgi:hypothetical protein